MVPYTAFVAVAASLIFAGSAAAQPVYGIASGKQCAGPINVGDPYVCVASIDNTNSTSQGTVTTDQVVDQVFHPDGTTAGGPFTQAINSSTVFPAGPVHLVDNGIAPAPSCTATLCTIPFGDHITVTLNHYTAQLQDVGVAPQNTLSDIANFRYRQVCDKPVAGNPCSTGISLTGAGAATDVLPVPTTTATAIHNAAHQTVTTVAAGTNVHDFVTVTGQPGQPNPTGNVTIDWFLNGSCSGAQAATGGPFVLDANGQVDASAFNFTVSVGQRAFLAHYAGAGPYAPSNGPCEPLNVVDATSRSRPRRRTTASERTTC